MKYQYLNASEIKDIKNFILLHTEEQIGLRKLESIIQEIFPNATESQIYQTLKTLLRDKLIFQPQRGFYKRS